MFKLLMAFGIVIMLIVGTVIGIQFMLASAEDKAKVKEALIPYVIGCLVIFGAFTIWSITVNILQDTFSRISAQQHIKAQAESNMAEQVDSFNQI